MTVRLIQASSVYSGDLGVYGLFTIMFLLAKYITFKGKVQGVRLTSGKQQGSCLQSYSRKP